MIVCSCNVLSDHAVREAVRTAKRRSTAHVYGCLGCSAQCGRCARTIRKIIDEALDGAKLVCPAGCACALHAVADAKAEGETLAVTAHQQQHAHPHHHHPELRLVSDRKPAA